MSQNDMKPEPGGDSFENKKMHQKPRTGRELSGGSLFKENAQGNIFNNLFHIGEKVLSATQKRTGCRNVFLARNCVMESGCDLEGSERRQSGKDDNEIRYIKEKKTRTNQLM